jgi:uncharacterized protein (DUF433 family)
MLSIAQMVKPKRVVHSDPDILGGEPVFMRTRVPLQTFIDYLERGRSLEDFLDDFPSVKRAQLVAVLEQARSHLLKHARSAG